MVCRWSSVAILPACDIAGIGALQLGLFDGESFSLPHVRRVVGHASGVRHMCLKRVPLLQRFRLGLARSARRRRREARVHAR